jgi:hypothetical protein
MVKFVIANRDDLLGGRLMPILNGLRLAEKTGAKFLTTWFTSGDAFQSLVAGLPEILSGPFLLNDPAGYLVDSDDPRVTTGSTAVSVRPCREAQFAGIGDFLVEPELNHDVLVLDRRFSLYAISEAETFSDVRVDLARIFRELPKAAVIEKAISQITSRLATGRFAALHARRLHLTSETSIQINRFDSYHTSETYRLVGEKILAEADSLLVASDSLQFVAEIKAAFPGRVMAIDDVLEVSQFTGIQRALLDLVFLSQAREVYGPLSAYGVVASIIGDGTFRNITRFAADHNIIGGDTTGCIALTRITDALASLLLPTASDAGRSAVRHRWASELLRHPGGEASALIIAVQTTASRLSEFAHPSFFADHQHFIHAAKEAASRAVRPDASEALRRLEQGLADRRFDRSPSETPPSDVVMAYIDLCGEIVAADCSSLDGAIVRFPLIIERARRMGINPRGLLLRLGNQYLQGANALDAVSAMRAAVAADPTYADSWYNLSLSLLHSGNHEAVGEMLVAARHATQFEPEQALYWHHLAAQLAAAGDIAGAIESRRRATTIEPENKLYAARLAELVSLRPAISGGQGLAGPETLV